MIIICQNSDEVNGIKLYQVLGNKFNIKTYEPSIKQDTGFNLTTLNSISGEIKDIECIKPTVLFAQEGKLKYKIRKRRHFFSSFE